MLQFIGRRLLFILLVCLFIIFSVHLGMRMVHNSEAPEPNYNLVDNGRAAWQETRNYLSEALHGEFGYVQEDYGYVAVKDILADAYINSMGLLLIALAIAAVIGLVLGSMAAVYKHGALTAPILTTTILGVAAPSFFIALLLQQAEILYVREFGRRLVSVAGFAWDWEHMLLPLLVLVARPIAYLTRASFLSLGQIMEEDFIRTAYSKGLTRFRTVVFHGLRNLAVPVLTAVGVSLRFSLSALPVVEMFFAWPGMGARFLQAINERQTSLVVSLALVLGLTMLMVNLLLDVIYRIVDPRLRAEA